MEYIEIIPIPAKEHELGFMAQLRSVLPDHDLKGEARDKLEKCVQFEAEYKVPMDRFSLVVVRPRHADGTSVKIKNLVLRPWDLLQLGVDATLGAVGVVATPYLIPLAVFTFVRAVVNGSKIGINEAAAWVALTMWTHRDQEREIDKDAVLDLVNRSRAAHRRSPLTVQDVRDATSVLAGLRCIEESHRDRARWTLLEEVRVKYG